MSAPHLFHVADLGDEVDTVLNAQGNPIFKEAKLDWCTPRLWEKGQAAPVSTDDSAVVYALIRNHGKSNQKDIVEYVGLTSDPVGRFANHATAQRLLAKNGTVGVSLAPINFIRGRNKLRNIARATEEIEHILIWALGPRENVRKNFTLPGMGSHQANAWHIVNVGYRFAGQMPREIVFPWMIVKLGRDRSHKVKK